MPVIDHVPPEPTVVVLAVVLCVPSLTTTETVSPTEPVPLAEVFVTLPLLTGFVTVEIVTVGAVVFFVVVAEVEVLLFDASVAVAV